MNRVYSFLCAFGILFCFQPSVIDAGLRSSLKSAYESTKSAVKSGYETTKSAISSSYEKAIEKLSDFKQEVADLYTSTIEGARSAIATHAHAHETASVRTGASLGMQELVFIQKRKYITNNAIRTMFPNLNLSDDEIPTVGFVESGGGFRAMIETAGALAGAEKTGLLNTFTYMAGLSGSTWCINPLVASGKQPIAYLDLLIQNLQDAPKGRDLLGIRLPANTELYHLARDLVVKAAYGQSINVLDLYGFLVSNELLANMPNVLELGGGKKQGYKMSDLAHNLKDGAYPLPISTAIEVSESPLTKWVELSPFEIGSYQRGMQAYVPTWAFGRKFSNGVSTIAPPELTLGYLLGICGSAFAIDFWGIIHETQEKLASILPSTLYKKLEESLEEFRLKAEDPDLKKEQQDLATNARIKLFHKDNRGMVIRKLTGGKVYNFTRDMNNQRMSAYHNMILVDGGHEIKKMPFSDEWDRLNLGAMPLLRPERHVDVLVMCDASAGNLGTALGAVETRAREDNLPFPIITTQEYEKAGKQLVSVFGAKTQGVPVVVYVPGILDAKAQGFSGTLNFKYNAEQIRHLAGITQSQFEKSASTIKQAIYDAIMKKRAAKQNKNSLQR